MELSEVAGAEGEEFGVMALMERFDSLSELVCLPSCPLRSQLSCQDCFEVTADISI